MIKKKRNGFGESLTDTESTCHQSVLLPVVKTYHFFITSDALKPHYPLTEWEDMWCQHHHDGNKSPCRGLYKLLKICKQNLQEILRTCWIPLEPTFSLSSFTFIKRILSSSSLSAIRVVSSAYLRLLIFLPAILIPGELNYIEYWITLIQ